MNIDKEMTFSLEITDTPIEKPKTILCRAEIISAIVSTGNIQPSKGKALLYFSKDSASARLISGDHILVHTTFRKPDGVINPDGFDYATYLKRQGIGATAYLYSGYWSKYGHNSQFSIFRLADNIQQKLLNVYHKFKITGDEFAVLAALTLGSTDALHPELRQYYSTSGGMHILSVSGLHVGVIFMVFMFLFRFLNKTKTLRIIKTIIIILLLWGYAFITGLPSSAIRATIMFSLVALGTGLERKAQIYNTISMAAFFMLLINPDYLFDVGFQLSYLAVISIVYFQPKISKLFTFKNKPMKWVWDLTAVSLAAQIGTMPLSLYYFHQFPNHFLLTNLVAIPISTFVIYTAVALFVFSSVAYVSTAIAFVLKWLLFGLNFSVEKVTQLPFSLTITAINQWQLLCLYSAIIIITVYLSNKKFLPLFLSLSFILIFGSISLYKNYNRKNLNYLMVFSDNSNTHVSFIKSGRNYVYTTDTIAYKRITDNFILQNKLGKSQYAKDKKWFRNETADFSGKHIMILTDGRFNKKTSVSPVETDYLILGNKLKPRIFDILSCVSPKIIIVDKTISEWYLKQIISVCAERNIPVYSIAERGAFVEPLDNESK